MDLPLELDSQGKAGFNIKSLNASHSGDYWCQSESGELSNIINIRVDRHGIVPKLTHDKANECPSKGATVTFTCDIGDSSSDWLFLWYRVVPLRDGLPADTHWSGRSTYSLELLSESSRGAGGSYTLNSANLEHFGLYVCRAKKEKPLFYTDYSKPMFLWVNDPESGRMSVSPNRTKYFQSESLSLVCGENRTGWTLRRITNYIEMSQCPFITGTSSWENGTCHISAVSQYDSGVYWCQSASGEFSNGLYIEVQNVRVSIKCKSGTWMNEGQQFEIGDSVELHCVVEGSSVDLRFLWYRLVPHRDGLPEAPRWNSDSRYSLELLLDSNTQADGTYTLNAAGPEHSGFYVCGVERGEPAYYIYSSPKLIWVKDSSPPALLNLSPNRTHFFKNESVSFTCEVPGNVSGWILRKYRNHQVPMDLPLELDSQGKAAFNIKSLNASHSGAYWCQTESGELSNIINIRVDNRPDPYIYVTPKDWLTAGDSVSLHCKIHKSYTSDTSWRILWYKIVSYKEELLNFTDEYSGSKYSLKLLSDSNSAAGSSYTFSSVHPEHSGLYVCRGEREQPVYHAAYSKPQLLWVKDASPKASLTISSNRTQYFPLDFLSLSCVVQGKASGWSLRRLTDSYPRSISDCPFNNTATWNHSTCNISSLGVSDSGVYWCQSESGQHSNAVKIKVNYDPHPVLHVSPSTWPAKGDTVTLKCEVSGSESGWTFLFYKVIAPIDEVLTESVQLKISETSTELLSQSSREAGASYTLTSVSPEHTGFYVCRAQRNNSSYHTPYSYLSHLWVIDPSPPAFLSIYPNSSVFFEYESLSMTCKIKGNSSGWTLRKFTNYNKASHCAFKHESVTWDEMPCTLRFLRIADGGHYWCQSESGEYSNAVNISVYGKPNVFLKVSPNHWVAEGASLKLTCMVFPFLTSGWIFLWYRVVASGEGMPIKTVPPHKEFSVQPLSDSDSESTGSYNQSSVGPQHSGIYVCRAKRKDSDYYTDYSQPQPVWVTSPSPSAWLSLTPNRTEYLVSQSLSLSCEVFGNTTGWMVRRYTSNEGLSDCPFGVRSGSWAESTCNISSLSTYDSGVYWCQSTSGELSNPVKTTVHMPGTIYSYVTVSPNQWVNEGSPVTLSCSVTTPSPGQRFQWYKAVPVRKGLPLVHSQSREAKYSVELLSDSSRGAGGSYTLSSVASEHSGLYVCRAEIEDLDTYTEYSQPQILTVTGYSPSAWLNVTPSRSQHFVSEPLTLSCKTKDSTTGWAVRRFTSWKELSDCPFNKKSEFMDSSTCNISSLTLSDSGVYWCQSESGKRSNAVNITVHTGKVLLESPVHPLREGEQVTLRCSNRKNLKSNLSATFYKDGLLVQNRTSAIMTILNVSKRDEGLYNCENEEKRRSPRSWVSVRAAHGESQGPHKRLRTMYQRFKDIL